MIIFFPAGRPASARHGEWHDLQDAPESKTLVLAAIDGAGRSLARKRAGGALPLPPGYPRAQPPAMRKTRPSARGSAPPANG